MEISLRAEAALIARYGSEVLGLLGQSDRSVFVAEKSLPQPEAPL
jgi:hypothetical protein